MGNRGNSSSACASGQLQRGQVCPRLKRVVFCALSLLIALPPSTAGGQHTVLDHPYTENEWHPLACGGERDEMLSCSWEVQRDGESTSQPVRPGTEFVRSPSSLLPGRYDLEIYLNKVAKGTYSCSCRTTAEQAVLRTKVYFYSAAQRFQFSDPNEIVGSELPVCYLKHLPESANLSTVTIVEEATGNKTAVPLERPDYCAHFSLKDRRPGLYHFQVTLSNGGDINSKSFRISQVQKPPLTEPRDDGTQKTIIAVVISISLIILLFVSGAVACVTGCCVWRRKRKNHHEDGHGIVMKVEPQPAPNPPSPGPPPSGPPPTLHEAEVNGPVDAGDPVMQQLALGTGNVDTGSVPCNLHQVHRADTANYQPPCQSSSPGNSDDATSVCNEPTEETALHQKPPSWPQSAEVEGNSGDEKIGVRGTRRQNSNLGTGITLVRIGNSTEVKTRDPPNPPSRNMVNDQ